MSAGHTPGPWYWVHHDEVTHDMPKLIGANGKEVCSFGNDTTYYPSAGDPPSPHDQALIAGAPETVAERDRLREQRDDLLEALEVLVGQAWDACGAVAEFNNMPCDSLRAKLPTVVIRLEKKIERARAAIAKAISKEAA